MLSPRVAAALEALRTRVAALLRLRAMWMATLCLATYYALTASRDLSLYDSGELALAATQLGLGHPPGQPLHTLLGHVAARVCAHAPLVGVNLVSAVPGALSLVPATLIAAQLTRDPRRTVRWAPWLILVFALHESLWEPATRVEVYSLATWLVLSAVAVALPVLGSFRGRVALQRRTGVAGLLLGLGASSNPVVAVAGAVALVPGILRAAWVERALWGTLGYAAVGGVVGLLPYLYLPLVAARSQVMIWGGLSDADSYVRYLTLRDYAHNQTLGLGDSLQHAFAWCAWSVEHLLAPSLLVGLGGFAAARSHMRLSASVFVGAFVVLLTMISTNAGWDLQVPDFNGYLGLAYWLAAAGSAALFATCLQQGRRGASAAIALCVGAALFVPPTPWMRTRNIDQLARTLGEQVLREAPQGAILISYSDYFAGTLFYLQEAEEQRPDVSVLAFGLSGSSWHWRHIQELHPELAPADLVHRTSRHERVRRWLADNAARPVLVERLGIAHLLGRRACAGGLYLRTGSLCDESPAPAVSPAKLLSDQLRLLGQGSPSAAGAIAEVSESLGSDLWRLGLPRRAHAVLLSGVPHGAWPAQLADLSKLAAADSLNVPAPHWSRSVALGDPARNLFLAGAVTAASGQPHAAQGYLAAAASLSLPEAQQLLAASH